MRTISINHIQHERRGVTLLVVLALMMMFAMLIAAFMLMVMQSRRAAELAARHRIDPQPVRASAGIGGAANVNLGDTTDIDEAILRLLIGGRDNIIGPHSIIENLYSEPKDGFELTGGLTVDVSGNLLQIKNVAGLSTALEKNELGNVVTVQFLDTQHPLHNQSTFVDDIRDGAVFIAPFTASVSIPDQATALSDPDCMLIFNAPQFSGTGAGSPFALLPNILAPSTGGTQDYKDHLDNNDVRMNPPYTAPDYKTMFLAWHDVRGGKRENVIPSFHRPGLVEDWNTTTPNDLNELRKRVLRPLPTDHPKFTGSNPAAQKDNLPEFLAKGPWDVDNDGSGTANGIWLDIGLKARYEERTRTWYKPLVSYYVIDMDGRVNVNAMGNLAQFDPSVPSGIKGTGMGVAELSSVLVPQAVLDGIGTPPSPEGRYGSDKKPGKDVSNFVDDLRTGSGINYQAYTDGGLVADWFGTVKIDFDNMGNRIVGTPVLPEHIPYLMNPYSDKSGDAPFRTKDLETLLRSVVDVDFTTLSARLRELLGESSFNPAKFAELVKRYNLTTRSSNIPVTPPLYEHVLKLCGGTGNEATADKLWKMLPEEVRRGEKVNLNRLTLHPLRDPSNPLSPPLWSVHWDTTATPDERNRLIREKAKFAQEMFYLVQVLFADKITDQETLERFAQWSINLVDFIDPDDTMTPFIFNPKLLSAQIADVKNTVGGEFFDHARLMGVLLGPNVTPSLLNDRMLIWGMEKPEVAITETFAMHSRNLQNNGWTTFTQSNRPSGSLFLELYRQGNPQRTQPESYPANGVVDQDGQLDLAKKTSIGDYVWRLAIGEQTKGELTKQGQVLNVGKQEYFTWWKGEYPERNAMLQLLKPDEIKYPQFYQWWYEDADLNTKGAGQYRPDLGRPERFIWFGKELPALHPFTPLEMEMKQRSFVNMDPSTNNARNVVLLPNSLLVIAPRAITYNNWWRPIINVSTIPNTMFARMPLDKLNWTETAGVNVPLGGMNVSEPLPIIEGNLLADPYPRITESSYGGNVMMLDSRMVGTISLLRGTLPCYKTICLQRLADPNRPHHPIGNPYITVDWNMIDLQAIHGGINPSMNGWSAEQPDLVKDDDMHMSSRLWKRTVSGFSNLWDRTLDADILNKDKAGLVPTGYDIGLQPPPPNNNHGYLLTTPIHSLGVPHFPAPATEPFLHFPWHDAPFMNTGELMLVPSSAPGRFGVEFHDKGTSEKFFDDNKPRFSYSYTESGNTSTSGPYLNWGDQDMQRLFDFVHVPSRFAGTIGKMREPGKINLNTVTEAGWETLQNGRNFPPNSYSRFRQYRESRRNAGESVLTTLPGLENESAFLIANDAINPYMILENATRLSDVTTTRSNVFAVWVTVGYFAVDKVESFAQWQNDYQNKLPHINSKAMFDAVYPDGCLLGAEMGLNDGTVKRHRTFYLIDRSTPVAFRRGEVLNAKDVIVKETALDK